MHFGWKRGGPIFFRRLAAQRRLRDLHASRPHERRRLLGYPLAQGQVRLGIPLAAAVLLRLIEPLAEHRLAPIGRIHLLTGRLRRRGIGLRLRPGRIGRRYLGSRLRRALDRTARREEER